MNKILILTLSWLAGGALGAIFFGGLWWTVRKAFVSEHPATWFFGSLISRMGIALAGFYFVSGGDWERLLLCLLGFTVARLVVTWLTRTRRETPGDSTKEASHAS